MPVAGATGRTLSYCRVTTAAPCSGVTSVCTLIVVIRDMQTCLRKGGGGSRGGATALRDMLAVGSMGRDPLCAVWFGTTWAPTGTCILQSGHRYDCNANETPATCQCRWDSDNDGSATLTAGVCRKTTQRLRCPCLLATLRLCPTLLTAVPLALGLHTRRADTTARAVRHKRRWLQPTHIAGHAHPADTHPQHRGPHSPWL